MIHYFYVLHIIIIIINSIDNTFSKEGNYLAPYINECARSMLVIGISQLPRCFEYVYMNLCSMCDWGWQIELIVWASLYSDYSWGRHDYPKYMKQCNIYRPYYPSSIGVWSLNSDRGQMSGGRISRNRGYGPFWVNPIPPLSTTLPPPPLPWSLTHSFRAHWAAS